jgi:predicted transcriptional regulator
MEEEVEVDDETAAAIQIGVEDIEAGRFVTLEVGSGVFGTVDCGFQA